MARSTSTFFQQSKISLNEYQQSVLRAFSSEGLTAEDLSGCDWLNSYCHEKALSFLVKQKKCSLNEVFSILDNLDENQAEGIFLGLSREEVVGLTKYQIHVFLKYGLSKDELIGLGQFQIQALLALKADGIKSDDLRGQNWINSYDHVVALLYLIKVKAPRVNIEIKKAFIDTCNYLKDLTSNEARAISYEIRDYEVKGLDNDGISLLIHRNELEGLKTREALEGLNEYQRHLVKRLYHFGLTSEMVRHLVKKCDRNVVNSIERLVFERGYTVKHILMMIAGPSKDALNHLVFETDLPVNQAIPMIDVLSNDQIYGLSEGLTIEEVKDLNLYQISALVRCRTIKNGLTADDLRDKTWFDSEKHVSALEWMLRWRWGEFTTKSAMQELDGLTGDQAEQVSKGKKRDDIFGLTEFQLKALDKGKLKRQGLTGSHLRGKDWFNSANHVSALEYLVKRKNLPIDEAINQLDGLSVEQVNLFITADITRDTILTLTPTQIEILSKKYEYGFYGAINELLIATWLTTSEQAELLKVLYDNIHNSSKALVIVKYATEQGHVKELLEKILNDEITNAELRHFNVKQDVSQPKVSSQSYSRRSGCSVM